MSSINLKLEILAKYTGLQNKEIKLSTILKIYLGKLPSPIVRRSFITKFWVKYYSPMEVLLNCKVISAFLLKERFQITKLKSDSISLSEIKNNRFEESDIIKI